MTTGHNFYTMSSRFFFNSFSNTSRGADFCSRAYKTITLDPKLNSLEFVHFV